MKVTKLINEKTKKPYISEDGKELVECRFELGDTFIPKHNSLKKEIKKVTKKTDNKEVEITEYTLLCNVKNKEGVLQEVNGSNDVFVTLTETQGKSIEKKLNDDILINQKLFEVREYDSAKYGKQIGLFLKGKVIPAKSFDELEAEHKTEK